MANIENVKDKKDLENKQLILIPKIENYIEYMLNVILKLPRTEKKKPCKLKNNKNIGLK